MHVPGVGTLTGEEIDYGAIDLRRAQHLGAAFRRRSTAMGTPHMRWREMHQSGRVAIMLAMRSSPQAGSHFTFAISSRARWRRVPPATWAFHGDEPLLGGAEDHGMVAAPAVRIGVLDLFQPQQDAAGAAAARRWAGWPRTRSCRRTPAGRYACGRRRRRCRSGRACTSRRCRSRRRRAKARCARRRCPGPW